MNQINFIRWLIVHLAKKLNNDLLFGQKNMIFEHCRRITNRMTNDKKII